MPCPKEWVVLDELNYVKIVWTGHCRRWSSHGHLRQLRHDRQRRAKLTCATFLTDYAPGPVRVEPLQNFRSSAT